MRHTSENGAEKIGEITVVLPKMQDFPIPEISIFSAVAQSVYFCGAISGARGTHGIVFTGAVHFSLPVGSGALLAALLPME